MNVLLSSFAASFVEAATGMLVFAAVAWMAGAWYFDLGRGRRLAGPTVLALLGAIGAMFLFWHPLEWPLAVTTGLFIATLTWWCTQKPSHERDWEPNVALLPRAEIADDQVTVFNVRNTHYGSDLSYEPRYETRVCRLSMLHGADLVLCYWGSTWMCHPLVIFDFGADGRLCMSVEVRYRRGQKFSLWPTLYRQQEMIYVVCDERDALVKRTRKGVEDVCIMYRLIAEPEELRAMALEYLEVVNSIYQTPRWYHGLTANCTTSVYRQRRGQLKWSWRWLVNGNLDRTLYAMKRLDQRLPFDQLRARSVINEIVGRSPAVGFGDALRADLACQLDLQGIDILGEVHEGGSQEGK